MSELLQPPIVDDGRLPMLLARAGALEAGLATHPREVRQALRLRYQVFAGELGARIGTSAELDRDIFDAWCHHVVVRDRARGEVVGTYRVLLPDAARELGALYADGGFWLTRLNPIRDELAELGRACVHPDYRSGTALMLLWSAIAEFLSRSERSRYVIGCVSVDASDGGLRAAALYRRLAPEHLAEEALRVFPRERLSVEPGADPPDLQVPPLMRAYLRAGACLLGEPRLDRDFGCADFPLLLQLDRARSRYQRRFVQ